LGILQFGIKPHGGVFLNNLGTEPVLSLKARVGLVKELPAGASVSYGRTYELERDSRIGIITAGYGDGVCMGLSNKGYVLIRGERYPVVGRVTMDQTIV